MAKLARNRGMLFASWTGTAIEESATVTKSGTGITGASIGTSDVDDFGTAVGNVTGVYEFAYDGTNWKLNGTTVTLSSYKIEVTGTPVSGDKIFVDYTAASGGWEALGKDDDDLSKDLNPDTETSKNVLGETTYTHKGYEPSVDMDTYYADPSRILFNHLLEIAMEEKYGGTDCIGYFAEAFFTAVNEQAHTMTGYCYVRKAWIVPQSIGGDTAGLGIPFTITPIEGMTKKNISYDMATNVATITSIS